MKRYLALEEVSDTEKTSDEQDRENHGEKIEVTVDKVANAVTKEIDHATDKKETCASTHQRSDNEN